MPRTHGLHLPKVHRREIIRRRTLRNFLCSATIRRFSLSVESTTDASSLTRTHAKHAEPVLLPVSERVPPRG